nr:MAG TPA: Flagellar and Swarming motility protein [Caudoviricetes sp.]
MLIKVTSISGNNIYLNPNYIVSIKRIEDRLDGKTVDRLTINLLGKEYVNLPYSLELEESIVKKVNYAAVS